MNRIPKECKFWFITYIITSAKYNSHTTRLQVATDSTLHNEEKY
jgi:hypothetical protein